jgi:hypothetical protein
MPDTPVNRRRARILRLLWDQWDQDRAAHRPSRDITTSTVWEAWYHSPNGLGPSRATARDDLAHLARTGHLVAKTNPSDGHRYYRLNTESVDRAGLWLMALPDEHPAFATLNQTCAWLDNASERMFRAAFQRAYNTAACGYPLPALDAHAERLYNQARTEDDRTEAEAFDLGVTAARTALAHGQPQHTAAAA